MQSLEAEGSRFKSCSALGRSVPFSHPCNGDQHYFPAKNSGPPEAQPNTVQEQMPTGWEPRAPTWLNRVQRDLTWLRVLLISHRCRVSGWNVERDLQKICLSFAPVGRDCIMIYLRDFFLFLMEERDNGFSGKTATAFIESSKFVSSGLGARGYAGPIGHA